MKISDKPTGYILIKAHTDSEWDCCDFALIYLSEEWKRQQAKRLEAVKPFADNDTFSSINFYDSSVNFFQTGDEDEPDVEELLADKEWAFVELDDDDETDRLTSPENRLECYKLVIYRDGNARYEAIGKYTNEEFWTSEFSLQQLTEQAVEF
jgi:hypothetical protein